MTKYVYIKKGLKDPFLVQAIELQLLNGYTEAVGSVWTDYESGKFLQLNYQQVKFHEKYPNASPKEVWELCLVNPDAEEEEIIDEFPDDIMSARQIIINKIENYDNSNNINKVIVNGQEVWFNKTDRAHLSRRYEIEAVNNIDKTTLWIGQMEIATTPNAVLDLLEQVEMYAAKCYDTTRKHINNVNLIDDISKLKKYNFKKNYPKIIEIIL